MTPQDNQNHNSKVIDFSGEPGEAGKLYYSVPLPGSYTFRRIIKLDFKPEEGEALEWLDIAKKSGTPLHELLGLQVQDGKFVNVDKTKAWKYWKSLAVAAGVSETELDSTKHKLIDDAANQFWRAGIQRAMDINDVARLYSLSPRLAENMLEQITKGIAPEATRVVAELGEPEVGTEEVGLTPDPEGDPSWEKFKGISPQFPVAILDIPLPTPTWSGKPGEASVTVDPTAEPKPQLFLVEIYGVSSFLGNYGAGRTVKTFTLLPGESTTISVRTWRATKESLEKGSCIVDSSGTTAKSNFANKLEKERRDQSAQKDIEKWYVDTEASASCGFASASVKAGGSGEYQSSREDFAKSLSDTLVEHAAETSAEREMTVTSSSESSTETEAETVVEREIRNVNMRRVLNFVFRELNQEYITKEHLKDIRIAFSNGNIGSYREVPLSGLRGLLANIMDEAEVARVTQGILEYVGVVFDHNDKPVNVLQKFTMHEDGLGWDIVDAALVDGKYPVPVVVTW